MILTRKLPSSPAKGGKGNNDSGRANPAFQVNDNLEIGTVFALQAFEPTEATRPPAQKAKAMLPQCPGPQ